MFTSTPPETLLTPPKFKILENTLQQVLYMQSHNHQMLYLTLTRQYYKTVNFISL